MSDVTVICCWTNEAMYNDFLDTLKSQDCPFELIGIDNRGNKGFTSCASAYNSVIDDVKTKYVIYSHQDILLNTPDVLSKFLKYMKPLGNDDILGVAGVKFETTGIISGIKTPHPYTGEFISAGTLPLENGIEECDTLDECFFGGHTKHFRDFPFDEVICDNWHLYAVDRCLHTKAKLGGRVWVFSTDIIHRSSGNISSAFVFGFCKLCRKYADYFPLIRTTCAKSFTDENGLRKYVLKYFLWQRPKTTFMRFLARINIYNSLRKVYRLIKKSERKE